MHLDDVPRDQVPEKIRVHAARQIVASRDGAEGPSVVVEARGLVDPRRLGGALAEPHHAEHGIVEPPRRSEPHRRIVARERGQLAAVRRLVQREQHERQSRVVAVRVEQRAQVARELRRDGDVSPTVGAELLGERPIVIPERPRVDLHHEPVFEGHLRHLHQEVRLEAPLVGATRLPLARLLKQHFGVVRGEPRRVRLEHGVIGGGGTQTLEERAAILEGANELGVVHERRAVLPAQCVELGRPAGGRNLEDGIGTEARDDLPSPPRIPDRAVPVERIARLVGGGEHLDVEPLEQRARPELG